MDIPLRIDEQIMNSDRVICRHLDMIGDASDISIGEVSQDILSHLRHFVEHIMLKIHADGKDIEESQDNLKAARTFIKNQSKFKFLANFYKFLEVSVSHRTLAEENARRLMLRYYEYLLRIKNHLRDNYSMEVLHNLEKFPIEIDDSYREYYEKIADKIDLYHTPIKEEFRFDRFYIRSIRPFFVNSKVYYEVAFVPANDRASKTDRIIAFTDIELSDYYAVRFAIADNSIEIFGKTMPIRIIVNWEVSIRKCEYRNFAMIVNNDFLFVSKAEQRSLSQYLTDTGNSLCDILDLSDDEFKNLRSRIVPDSDDDFFFDVLDYCRQLSKNQRPGVNILRYLLLHMTNRVLRAQYDKQWRWDDYTHCREYVGPNSLLSNLYLSNKCIPFDDMPFCSALRRHVPGISDIFECFDAAGREHEIIAWLIRHNTEQKGILFTKLEKSDDGKYRLLDFDDVESLVKVYNSRLYDNEVQQSRKLVIEKGHIFIESYREDTVSIIKTIKEMTAEGVTDYSKSVKKWLDNQNDSFLSDEQKSVLINLFDKSRAALIYGAAGTGKTTLINYISKFFEGKSMLYLAHTNPAVNNLKRRVSASSECDFMTITKFNNKYNEDLKRNYDILIIDECSTVSNKSMKQVLELAEYNLLILVGDVCQIEAIEFGNWFCAAKSFIPETSVFELKKAFRTESRQLLGLWNSVRNIKNNNKDSDAFDRLQAGEFSAELDTSIFTPLAEDEIILCLNYGGLYGINNINYFMQEHNSGKEIYRGIQRYKVGDPILFNDAADSFFSNGEDAVPVIHNNMKARIVDFAVLNEGEAEESIQFDVELDKPISGLNIKNRVFTIIGTSQEGNSIIRFEVFKNRSTDGDCDGVSNSTIPFQIAYAVSIHKAQGLEYDSVKIVITDEIDELITHSIFYTAITRAKKRLKIYWSESVERKILERIKPIDNRKDIALLESKIV